MIANSQKLSVKKLHVLAISHDLANLAIREKFHLSLSQEETFAKQIMQELDIEGIMILSTCNRTEIYFESASVTSRSLLDYLVEFKTYTEEIPVNCFCFIDDSVDAADYILKVASGLKSLLLGDMQIISQIRDSYKRSLERNTQGGILERVMQAVFRMHKRIHNETAFRSGSASMSYLALTTIRKWLGVQQLSNKKLLIVGAGDVGHEVAKYVHKFNFKSVAIVNRTKAKAELLAVEHQLDVLDWENLEQAVNDFDCIITGISKNSFVIPSTWKFEECWDDKVFVDLGVPLNVDPKLTELHQLKLINVDDLKVEAEQNIESRKSAIASVKEIISQELKEFELWAIKIPANQAIKKFKNQLNDLLLQEINAAFDKTLLPEDKLEEFINSVSKKMLKKPAKTLNSPRHSSSSKLLESFNELFAL